MKVTALPAGTLSVPSVVLDGDHRVDGALGGAVEHAGEAELLAQVVVAELAAAAATTGWGRPGWPGGAEYGHGGSERPVQQAEEEVAALPPYTRVIRLLAMLPSGSSWTANCASTAAKSARSATARPVTSAVVGRGGAADVLVPHQVQRLRGSQPGGARAGPSRRRKRMAGGSAGAGGRVEGANGSRPVNSRSQRNSRTLSPSLCASQPNRNTVAHVCQGQRGGRAEAQRPGDQAEFRAGQVAGRAQRGLVAEQRLAAVGEEVAVSVVRERRGLPSGRVFARGQAAVSVKGVVGLRPVRVMTRPGGICGVGGRLRPWFSGRPVTGSTAVAALMAPAMPAASVAACRRGPW